MHSAVQRRRDDGWQQAVAHFTAGRLPEAEVELKRLLRITPVDDILRAPYLQVLGRIRAATGRVRGAATAFDASFRVLAQAAVESWDRDVETRQAAGSRLQGAKYLSVSLAGLHPTRSVVLTAWRHVRTCKTVLPALRSKQPLATSVADQIPDPRRAAPPDGLLLEITRYVPADLRNLARSEGLARYGAFVVGDGRSAAVTYFDLGPAEELDDLIALARQELSGESSLRGGSVTLRAAAARSPQAQLPADSAEKWQISHITYERSGQRIELAGRPDAEALRSFMRRFENSEPLSLSEIRQLGSDGSSLQMAEEQALGSPPTEPEAPDPPEPIRDLGTSSEDQPPAAGSPETAREIGQRLFGPLTRRLRRVRHLTIAPDGEFWLLPFAAVSVGDATPLVNRVDITLDDHENNRPGDGDVNATPSSSVRPRGVPLVIADPAYSSAAVRTTKLFLAPLPGARKEGMAVAALLGVACHSRADATDTLLRMAPAPAIVHLATHGFAVPDRRAGGIRSRQEIPEGMRGLELLGELENHRYRTGVALAGAEDWFSEGDGLPGPGDGVLLAADITNLDLQETELVVLSACHTGMGHVDTDDSPWSVGRAFRQAGADTVVTSLWTVPDDSTRQLMEAFYKRLLDDVAPARALRDAQLLLIASGASLRQWAAFTCLGTAAMAPLAATAAQPSEPRAETPLPSSD